VFVLCSAAQFVQAEWLKMGPLMVKL
jgi:hypothetical protein